jgi:hypothetical protein
MLSNKETEDIRTASYFAALGGCVGLLVLVGACGNG